MVKYWSPKPEMWVRFLPAVQYKIKLGYGVMVEHAGL